MKSWWMTLTLVSSVTVNMIGTGVDGRRPGGDEVVGVSGGGIGLGDQDGDGPGDCWDVYVEEAIEAYIEYEECMSDEQWWDLWGQTGCAAIYEMRAIGAFSWWVSCVGFRS